MKVGATCCAVALVLAALGLQAGTAVGKPGYVVTERASHELGIGPLRGAHGFEISALLVNRRSLEVVAEKGDTAAIYLIDDLDQHGADGIHANLPGVGRIALTFHPRGKAEHEPRFFPPCKGGGVTRQRGLLTGRIDLVGERRYTALHSSRASGTVTTTHREVCKRSIFDENDSTTEVSRLPLSAAARTAHGAIGFSANVVGDLFQRSKGETSFYASLWEKRRGMTIARLATTNGGAEDFTFGDNGDYPASATASPPAPFHGSAVFERLHGNKGSWTGDLSVVLPGAGRVHLAGDRFRASVCNGDACKR